MYSVHQILWVVIFPCTYIDTYGQARLSEVLNSRSWSPTANPLGLESNTYLSMSGILGLRLWAEAGSGAGQYGKAVLVWAASGGWESDPAALVCFKRADEVTLAKNRPLRVKGFFADNPKRAPSFHETLSYIITPFKCSCRWSDDIHYSILCLDLMAIWFRRDLWFDVLYGSFQTMRPIRPKLPPKLSPLILKDVDSSKQMLLGADAGRDERGTDARNQQTVSPNAHVNRKDQSTLIQIYFQHPLINDSQHVHIHDRSRIYPLEKFMLFCASLSRASKSTSQGNL